MMIASWAWLAVVSYQTLMGMVAAKENNNSLRKRWGNVGYNEESDYINKGRRRTKTTDRLSRTIITRDLHEEQETNDPSDEQRFPFLVSLMDESLNHICGGSLIARDMVLTAASCQGAAILSYVRFQDGMTEEDLTVEISTTFPHPEYNERTREHNIMLVQLSSPVEPPSSTTENMLVQVVLDDVATSRPSMWPVPILKEGQILTGFNYRESTRYSNDVNDTRIVENQWENWKLAYIGKDTCMEEIEGANATYDGLFADDSFCVERRDVQLLSFSSGSKLCQPGEVGGPILWMSDTTNARLLLGVNSWGIGCLSSILPDVASLANAGGDFIRSLTCAESATPPSYMGCSSTTAASTTTQKEPSSSTVSTEFGVCFGHTTSTSLEEETTTKTALTTTTTLVAVEPPDPVTVYILFLFDSTTAEHISWTITETSSNALVASATDGTYASATDFTELVSLIPGKSYTLEIVDGSSSAASNYTVGGNTDFAIVISEPPKEVESGQIDSGMTQSFTFKVLDGNEEEEVEAIVTSTASPVNDTTPPTTPPTTTAPTTVTITTAPVAMCIDRGDLCESDMDCCSKLCASDSSASRNKVYGSDGYGVSAAGVIESSSRQFDNG